MKTEVIDRTGKESPYLHRDFHLLLNRALNYIGKTYHEEGVKAYLQSYARHYFSPMTLPELEQYFHRLYQSEEAEDQLNTDLSENGLRVAVSACPAVRFIRSMGDTPSPYYVHTVNTLYGELAKICGMEFTMEDYQTETGATVFRFRVPPEGGTAV